MIRALWNRIQFVRFCSVHKRSLSGIRAWQKKRLKQLIRHAYDTVPLWRTLLTEAHVEPDSVRAPEDLSRIPVTSRETYIGRMVEEYIDNSHRFYQIWRNTSGTSGKPFRCLAASIYSGGWEYTDFASFRFLWWRGWSLRRIFNARVAQIKISSFAGEDRLFVPVAEFQTNPGQALSKIAGFKSDILVAYPSVLLDIAKMVSEDISLPSISPTFALSFGEMLSSSARDFITRALRCEVYNRYGLEEIGVIGIECTAHDGFHVNSESVIVEIADGAGVPLVEGRYGRIVVTDLLNYNMPFIRYDTGDHGTISFRPCTCGLRTPRVWVEGRYSASLSFGGRRIHHLEFDAALDSFMNSVLQYQVVKVGEAELRIRVVRGAGFGPAIETQLRENIQRLVGDSVRVSVELTPNIPRTPSGKCRIVVDETTPRPAPAS